jgi:solute carrier family 25 S-adenosylmethionine transporter 26
MSDVGGKPTKRNCACKQLAGGPQAPFVSVDRFAPGVHILYPFDSQCRSLFLSTSHGGRAVRPPRRACHRRVNVSALSGIVMVAITPSQLAQVGPRPNALRLKFAGATAVACGGALAVSWQRGSRRSVTSEERRKFRGQLEGALRRLAANATAVDCVSGGLGEAAALLSFFPLDTLKVHCQARSMNLQQALAAVLRQGPVVAVRSLYAGVGTAAIGAAIVGAVHLSVFKYWKRLEERLNAASTPERTSAAPSTGILAVWGAIVSSITVGALEAPLDQVKLRIQANTIRGTSPLKMLLETLSSVGARQMFNSSFVPFVLKAIPHDVGEFVTFGVLSEDHTVQRCLGPISENAKDALLGAAAGCAAALLSNPFDVICTKVQTSPTRSGDTHHTMRSSLVAFRDTARAEFAQGGMRRLYVGLVPRLMQMVPASVIYWLVVEEVRRSIVSRYAPNPA